MASSHITISDERNDGFYTPLRSTPRKRNFSGHISISDESNCAKRKCCCSTSSTSSTDESNGAKRKCCCSTSSTSSTDESNCAKLKCCCSTSSTDNELDESWSTFSCNSILLNTQDINGSSVTSSNAPQCDEPVSNRNMESLKTRKHSKIMPTTSSPISKRRDIPFTNYVGYTPPSDTYCLWRKNLHKTPTFSIRYFPGLPEAEAGQFGPLTY